MNWVVAGFGAFFGLLLASMIRSRLGEQRSVAEPSGAAKSDVWEGAPIGPDLANEPFFAVRDYDESLLIDCDNDRQNSRELFKAVESTFSKFPLPTIPGGAIQGSARGWPYPADEVRFGPGFPILIDDTDRDRPPRVSSQYRPALRFVRGELDRIGRNDLRLSDFIEILEVWKSSNPKVASEQNP